MTLLVAETKYEWTTRTEPPRLSRRTRLARWITQHRQSLLIVSTLLALIGILAAWNMDGWPGRINDDEGTYVAEAWAVATRHELAPYTYWYDHPPFGWLTIAAYALLTDGFHRALTAVTVGREVMWIANLVSGASMYVLVRRLGLRRAFAVASVLLFALSPLSMQYHRMVFLDNLAVMWVLAAMALAASNRRSLGAALGSAACLAAGVLSKETSAVLLPAVLWTLIQYSDRRTLAWRLVSFLAPFVALVSAYPLYAILKNELLPGPGHVSLTWALWWQLFGRGSSGSLLDPHSGTFALARSWTDVDPWLLLAGLALAPLGFLVSRIRPAALALLIQVAMMCRGGYMPYPYVISLLPFAAIVIAGVGDGLWRGEWPRFGWRGLSRLPMAPWLQAARHRSGQLAVVAAAGLFAFSVAPAWAMAQHHDMVTDDSRPSLEATRWVEANVPRNAVLLVDDNIWPDLAGRGYTGQIWFYKADLDPAVHREFLRDGYRDVDYVVLGDLAASTINQLPTVGEAIQHSTVVATFGGRSIVIRKVIIPST
jgi:Dolichyl-phosphate-mannose-protein mannosyltransferase